MGIEEDIFGRKDVKIYLDELQRRLMRYAGLCVEVPKGEPGSVEWLGRIGKFWQQARESQGLTRFQVAERLKDSANSIRFLEVGMGYVELGVIDVDGKINPTAALESDLLKGYANALGQPELYQEFVTRFHHPAE